MSNQKPQSIAEQLASGVNPGAAADGSPNKAPAANAASSGVAPLAGVTALNTDTLGALVQLLMMQQARIAKKEQEEEDRQAARTRQREKNAAQDDSKIISKQARCKHLKGGRNRVKNQTKIDYAVYQHVFVDSSTYIRCRVCGMKWRPKDTVEYLVRGGQKISNHTHIGWREAFLLTDQSSDSISKSETIVYAMPEGGMPTPQVDNTGLPIIARIVDLEGKPVANVEM
jgi:hypothetical protein